MSSALTRDAGSGGRTPSQRLLLSRTTCYYELATHRSVDVVLVNGQAGGIRSRGKDGGGGSGGLDGVGGVRQRADHSQRHAGACLADGSVGAARETRVGGLLVVPNRRA